jgi:hypothetical protein
MLSLRQINDVCLGQDETYRRCRYLAQDETDSSKYYCCKLSSKAKELDDEIDSYLKDCKKRNYDPRKDNLPLGDNCQGYVIFRELLQGYDVD